MGFTSHFQVETVCCPDYSIFRTKKQGRKPFYGYQAAGSVRLCGGDLQLFQGGRAAAPDAAHHQLPHPFPGAGAEHQAHRPHHQGDLSLRGGQAAVQLRQGDPHHAGKRHPGHPDVFPGNAGDHHGGGVHHPRAVLPAPAAAVLPGKVSGHQVQHPDDRQRRCGGPGHHPFCGGGLFRNGDRRAQVRLPGVCR